MVLGLSRMMTLRLRRNTAAIVPLVEPAAVVARPDRHLRVGLWVLSSFATIAALVAITGLVIGTDHADMMIVLPLTLVWSVVVSVGFAVRSALLNVMRPLTLRLGLASASDTASGRSSEKPDATLERLARMVRTERNREALHPHPALAQG